MIPLREDFPSFLVLFSLVCHFILCIASNSSVTVSSSLLVILGSLYYDYRNKVIDLAIETISLWFILCSVLMNRPKPIVGHSYLLPLFDLYFQVSLPDIRPCRLAVCHDAPSQHVSNQLKRSYSLPESKSQLDADRWDSQPEMCHSYPRWEEVKPSGETAVSALFNDSVIHRFPGSIPVVSSPTGELEVDEDELTLLQRSRELGRNLPKDCSAEGYFTVLARHWTHA